MVCEGSPRKNCLETWPKAMQDRRITHHRPILPTTHNERRKRPKRATASANRQTKLTKLGCQDKRQDIAGNSSGVWAGCGVIRAVKERGCIALPRITKNTRTQQKWNLTKYMTHDCLSNSHVNRPVSFVFRTFEDGLNGGALVAMTWTTLSIPFAACCARLVWACAIVDSL